MKYIILVQYKDGEHYWSMFSDANRDLALHELERYRDNDKVFHVSMYLSQEV